MKIKTNYGEAIRQAFEYLLSKYPEVFVIGQGLWSPWYVGNTMKDLDKSFGKKRIIDTPVSESACTGFAVGASLCNSLPIVVHPRIDFMLYAIDPIVNQAAKWSHMTGGSSNPSVTIRGIINRGGEQGAQHSQSLHSWFAHIPGLKVVMPYSVQDARDLLICSVLSKDPVVYIDDRWLYDNEDKLDEKIEEKKLSDIKPKILSSGSDITLIGSGYSTQLIVNASEFLKKKNISCEVIDVRVLNPFQPEIIIDSVAKTKNLLVVDGSWKNSGFASEVITSVMEKIDPKELKSKPQRITLADSPAPASRSLEKIYYPSEDHIIEAVQRISS